MNLAKLQIKIQMQPNLTSQKGAELGLPFSVKYTREQELAKNGAINKVYLTLLIAENQ